MAKEKGKPSKPFNFTPALLIDAIVEPKSSSIYISFPEELTFIEKREEARILSNGQLEPRSFCLTLNCLEAFLSKTAYIIGSEGSKA